MKLPIIFEDESLLVINKPAGVLTHPTHRGGNSVVDWLAAERSFLQLVGEPLRLAAGVTIDRYGLLHRLDKDTSGVLLIAKTEDSFHYYKQLFHRHDIKKTYRAIVYGRLALPEGVIDVPLGRSRRDPRYRAAGAAARGQLRPATTHYQTLCHTDNYSYLELRPTTGRTHQLRVHLKTLGHPIVCDAWYAAKKPCPPELGRLGLHALSVELTTIEGSRLVLAAEPPNDFQAALAALKLTC